ncbi:hypothetical protein ACUXST_002453 [Sphingomonas sp. F9_3S_D5_B_2]
MKSSRVAAALLLVSCAAPAFAGPPYLTDDPAPTDVGHWEIFAFTAAGGRGSDLDDDTGLDLNYGVAKDVQLTATVPVGLSHEASSAWRAGTGDLELAVKYRVIHDERRGISAAVFPRVILPTSSLEHGGKARVLLPAWVQKDFAGGTSLFGGGGYEINPGAGNRDFWQVAAAVTHDLNEQVSLGAELARQGRDAAAGSAETNAGFGGIVKISEHHAVLVSAGPTWSGHRTGYHLYAGLGLNL